MNSQLPQKGLKALKPEPKTPLKTSPSDAIGGDHAGGGVGGREAADVGKVYRTRGVEVPDFYMA